MQLPCCVVLDLLPLYAEGMTDEHTGAIIREHLQSCPACCSQLEQMQNIQSMNHAGQAEQSREHPDSHHRDDVPMSKLPLQRVHQELSRRRLLSAVAAASAVFLALFITFSWLSKPIYPAWSSNLVSVQALSQGEQKMVTAVFSDQITATATERYTDQQTGERVVIVTGWGAFWDRWLNKGQQSAVLASGDQPADVIYYCDCSDKENMTLIYSADPSQKPAANKQPMGIQAMPRLTLTYYAWIAIAACVLLGVVYVLFRKTKASGICGALFWVPISYLLGQFAVMGFDFTTYLLMRDLVMIGIATAAFYLFLFSAGRLLTLRKNDRQNLPTI